VFETSLIVKSAQFKWTIGLWYINIFKYKINI